MANYNSLNNLIIDIIPGVQDYLRKRGSIYRYANSDFSQTAVSNQGATIDAVFASNIAVSDVVPSPSGTNVPPASPTRIQLTLASWKKGGFMVTPKEEQEITAGNSWLAQQTIAATEAVVSQMELDFLNEAISGSGYQVQLANSLSSSLSPLAQARKNLSDALTPTDNRAFIFGTNLGLALSSNTQLQKVNEAGDSSLLRNGDFGRILGFDLVESNYLTSMNYQTSGSLGLAIGRQGLGVAVRPGNLGPNVIQFTDPITGMPLTITTFQGEYIKKVEVSALYGVKTIRSGSICLVSGV